MALVVAILTSLVLLLIAAFAIDLGMQRAGRRDMQALADMVALDMGRLIDGRTRAQIEAGDSDDPSATAQLSWSVANNDDTTVGSAPTVTAYWVDVAADGSFAEANGVPIQVASTEVPDGVVVRAGADVALAFAGVTGASEDGVERSAVAMAEESACFRLGSYAARLDTASSELLDAILGDILGGGVSLDVLSYSGLADADVILSDLALELGLATVDELLTASIDAGTLLIAAANVLQADGNSNVDVLNSVAAHTGGIAVDVGDLVSAEPGSGAAETATVDALDLTAGTVLLANGTNAVAIPSLTASLPFAGTSMTSSLTLIERPRQRCGKRGSQAQTSQVDLDVSGSLVSLPTVLGLTPTDATTQIGIDVASATGTLTDISCGTETPADPSGEDVQVTSGLVGASATLGLSFSGTATGSGPISGLISGITSLVQNLLTPIVQITVSGSVTIRAETAEAAATRTAEIRVPNSPTDWDEAVSTGSGDLGLTATGYAVTSNTLAVTAKGQGLLGLVDVNLTVGERTAIINNLIAAVAADVLDPLVTSVNSTLLHPLYDVLGLTVGGADVLGQRPYCRNPVLVG